MYRAQNKDTPAAAGLVVPQQLLDDAAALVAEASNDTVISE
jgi:hypothetical protein